MTTLLLLFIAHESDQRRQHTSNIRVALEMSLQEETGHDFILRTTVTLRENRAKPIRELRETLTRTFGEPHDISESLHYWAYTYLPTDHPWDVRNKVRHEIPTQRGDRIQGLLVDVGEAITSEVDAFAVAPMILMTALSLTPPGKPKYPMSLKPNMRILYWVNMASYVRTRKGRFSDQRPDRKVRMIGLMELSPVIYLVFDVQRTWDAVIVESPYRINLFNLSGADLSRWREAFRQCVDPRNASRSALYLKVDDLDRCREILRLVSGHDTPDLQKAVVEKTLRDVMLDRFSCANNLMTLKSLVPPLPRDVDQDVTIDHLDLINMVSLRVVHEGVTRYVPINSSDSKIRASDVATFASKVPAVRWDKLDYVLETFHLTPIITMARPDDTGDPR